MAVVKAESISAWRVTSDAASAVSTCALRAVNNASVSEERVLRALRTVEVYPAEEMVEACLFCQPSILRLWEY